MHGRPIYIIYMKGTTSPTFIPDSRSFERNKQQQLHRVAFHSLLLPEDQDKTTERMADYGGSSSSTPNHYAVLGLKNNATTDEIKSAYRRLCKETHPDLHDGCSTKAAMFKRINNAHSTLSDPSIRRQYDQELQEQTMWRARGMYNYSNSRMNNNDPFASGFHRNVGRNGGGRRHPPGGMHAVMETLQSPRFLLFGLVGVGSVTVLGAVFGSATSSRPEYYHNSRLVEAWRNPKTNQWEQPAPWDPQYRRLKPKLELVPREKVRKRHL